MQDAEEWGVRGDRSNSKTVQAGRVRRGANRTLLLQILSGVGHRVLRGVRFRRGRHLQEPGMGRDRKDVQVDRVLRHSWIQTPLEERNGRPHQGVKVIEHTRRTRVGHHAQVPEMGRQGVRKYLYSNVTQADRGRPPKGMTGTHG